MANLEFEGLGAVSKFSKVLQDAMKHPDDCDIGFKVITAMKSYSRSIEIAMRTISSESSHQHASAINVLIRFAGTLGQLFKLASVQDKGGDVNGRPPPLTVATIGLAVLFSIIIETTSKCGSASDLVHLFGQVTKGGILAVITWAADRVLGIKWEHCGGPVYLMETATSILKLAMQLFTCAIDVHHVPLPTEELLISFWALERAAHVQEAVFRLSEKIVDDPAGRVTAILSTLRVADAAQRRSILQWDVNNTQPVPPQIIAFIDERSIRHVLKLLDLALLDLGLGGERNRPEVAAGISDSIFRKETAGNVCCYLSLATSTVVVTGGLVKEICFSQGLAKIVSEYSAGDVGGAGEFNECTALPLISWAMNVLREGADVVYGSKTLVTSVSHAEGIEMMSGGISAESLRSLTQTMMGAARQAAAVQKLRSVPLTSRSKAIQKALNEGYLQNKVGKDKLVASLGMREASDYQKAGILHVAVRAMFGCMRLQSAVLERVLTVEPNLLLTSLEPVLRCALDIRAGESADESVVIFSDLLVCIGDFWDISAQAARGELSLLLSLLKVLPQVKQQPQSKPLQVLCDKLVCLLERATGREPGGEEMKVARGVVLHMLPQLMRYCKEHDTGPMWADVFRVVDAASQLGLGNELAACNAAEVYLNALKDPVAIMKAVDMREVPIFPFGNNKVWDYQVLTVVDPWISLLKSAADVAEGADLQLIHKHINASLASAKGYWLETGLDEDSWETHQRNIMCCPHNKANENTTALLACINQLMNKIREQPLPEVPHSLESLRLAQLPPGCLNDRCLNLAGVGEQYLATLVCSGCKTARYCSQVCQKQHWKAHKKACQAMQ